MGVNAEAMTDFVLSRAMYVFPTYAMPTLPRHDVLRCDYCGRGAYLSEGLTCKGCGGPLPIDEPPAMLVDSRLYDDAFIRALGVPGANIPIGMPKRGWWSEFVDGAAGAALAMFAR